MFVLTQQTYQNAVFTAQRANAALTQSLRAKEALGLYPDWNLVSCQSLKIASGEWSLAVLDYASTASVDIYNQLLDIGSSWSGGISIDPNAQISGTTIVTVPVLQSYNTGKLPFSTTGGAGLTLANYNNTYLSIYGNNPTLALVDNAGNPLYIEDKQTPPQYRYTNDDPNQPLLSIFWDIPVPTSGYVQISGVAPSPASGSPSAANSGSYQLNFTQGDLLDAGGGNYYLPLVLPSNRNPVYMNINNVGQPAGNYDRSVTPARLYGFANNSVQVIVLTIS